MIRYNLLDKESSISCDDKVLPSTQHYSGTTVTISDIPALQARINNSDPISTEESMVSTEESMESQM